VRDFSKKVPKSMFHKAVRIVLSDMFASDKLAIIESLERPSIKTKDAVKQIGDIRAAAKLSGKTVAVIIKSGDKNLWRSLRNVPAIEIYRVSDVSPYRLLRAGGAIITREALAEIERIFAQ